MAPLERQIERLAGAGFQLLPAWQITTHYVVERSGFVALVERRFDGAFGNIGAPGILLEGQFATLVWRGKDPLFVAKGRVVPATKGQVEALRLFDSDLREALQERGQSSPGLAPR